MASDEEKVFKAEYFNMDEIEVVKEMESPENSDEDEPEVENIEDEKITSDNHTNCNLIEKNDKLTALKEVFDEETCTNMLIGFYDACSEFILSKF